MATKIFRPRRGRKSTMLGRLSSTVLDDGEFFVEVPDTGVGTGPSKVKMGDGETAYPDLPYAIGDTESDIINYSDSAATTVASALTEAATGKTLKSIIAGLKKGVQLNRSSIDTMNTEMTAVKKSVSDGKTLVANAITAKGISTATDASFQVMATNIAAITTGTTTTDATATAAQILSGATAYVNGVKITGQMTNNGAVTITPGTSNKTIPAGYHNGNGVVTGDSNLLAANIKYNVPIFNTTGTFTSDGTITAAGMLVNTIGYSKGAKVVGTMPNNGTVNITPGTSNKVIALGYHSGSGVVYGDPNLVSSKIKDGETIFGVTGSYKGGTGKYAKASGSVSSSTASGSVVATVSLPNVGSSTSLDFINSATSYMAIITVLVFKQYSSYYGTGTATAFYEAAKFFIRYQDGITYLYGDGGGVSEDKASIGTAGVGNISTDPLGGGWGWDRSGGTGNIRFIKQADGRSVIMNVVSSGSEAGYSVLTSATCSYTAEVWAN